MYRPISHLRTPLKSLFPHPNHSFFRTPIDPSNSAIYVPSSWFHSSPFLNFGRQRKEDSNDDVSLINRDPDSPPKLFVVQPRLRSDTQLKAKLSEALNLANSLEEQRDGYFDTELCDKELPPHIVVQNPSVRSDKARADTYFGAGTVDTIKCHLNAIDSQDGVDAVFVNTILSGIQQRNLEGHWGKPVLDRVGLIIEIFNAHAYTKEAKLQAELAALMYQKTRLVCKRGADGRNTFGASGESEVVSARGRGSGGRGFMGGAGETELQLQRRRLLERRSRLLSLIEDVRRTRALQRASRKRRGGSHGEGLVTVAVVGYTNAGKSTLVSALSETDLFSDDRMFATVDPRLRNVVLPSGRKVLLSDTVGFISDLPVQLVEAFHATLEEVVEADLLVHVLDSSAPDLDDQHSTVLQVLQQIGVSQEKLDNMIEVWNKIDLQNEEMHGDEYPEDGEGDKAASFLEIEDVDVATELSQGEEEDEACSFPDEDGSFLEEDGGDASKPSCEGEEEDEACSFPDEDGSFLEEDGGDASKPSCEESNENYDEDDKDDIVTKLSTDIEEIRDSQETEDDEDGSSVDTVDCSVIGKRSHSQIQHVPHVKTSAVMGVGLQELLVLIDEKLKTHNIVERGSLDRKWRPPRTDDAGIALEQ